MARPQGTLKISANIEPNAAAPLDARAVVDTVADLTTASNFPYPYVGMLVVVKATGDLYVLTADTVTVADNWHKVGGGDGANNVVEGYYYDEKFYEDNLHTVEIEGEADTLYISVDTNVVYRYDGSEFVIISAEGQITQVDTLPTADLTEVGNIYQYTGTTTADYTHGLFYECVNNSGVYDWKNIPVDKKDTVTLTQAQFDALSQAEKDNGTTYYITDSSAVQGISVMGNRFDKANIYTDTERMIGSYMGKPLYQKTFGATVSAEYSLVSGVFMRGSYSLLDANLDIEDMPFADGFYTDATNNETESFIDVWYNTADSKLYFITYLDRENIVAEFTIQYTKVHDGTVAIGTGNDYSTDEQIIGSWIDGKPLYQKTFEIPANKIPNNNSTVFSNVFSNADTIVDFKGMLRTKSSISSYTWTPLPRIQPNSYDKNMGVDIDTANNAIYLKGTGFDYTAVFDLGYMTILYTKTTD